MTVQTFTATQRLRKHVATRVEEKQGQFNGNAFQSETYHRDYQEIDARLELSVDVAGLMQSLGQRAIHNRSGAAALLGGMVKVKVVKQ